MGNNPSRVSKAPDIKKHQNTRGGGGNDMVNTVLTNNWLNSCPYHGQENKPIFNSGISQFKDQFVLSSVMKISILYCQLNSSCGKTEYRLAPRSFPLKGLYGRVNVILMYFGLGNCSCEMRVRKGLAVFVLLNACGFHCNLTSHKHRKKKNQTPTPHSFEIAKLFIKETLLGPSFLVEIGGGQAIQKLCTSGVWVA